MAQCLGNSLQTMFGYYSFKDVVLVNVDFNQIIQIDPLVIGYQQKINILHHISHQWIKLLYMLSHVYYQMNYTETIIYSLNLPAFLLTFKDKCLAYIIPLIDSCILFVQGLDGPIFFLLLILILVQLFRTILLAAPSEAKQANSNSENRQISKEIKDLKKELKSIQTMLAQLKAGNLNAAPSAVTDCQESSRIIKLCKESWEKREEIASEIMDWQLKIIKEVTKLKNKSRSMRSPSKITPNSQQNSAQSIKFHK